jgi:uncharacterized protein DUF6600
MRWTVVMRALGVALVLAMLPTARASASSFQVDVGLFYNDLAPHGRWVANVQYGRVWVPAVSASWRPYSVGHWVWTDDNGWLWVSDEDFGWAVYHYGRWYEDPAYGWAWVPGYEWGPAWVSFRSGGGYMGWAPLPPRVTWAAGFSVGPAEFDTFIDPRAYCFVADRDFVAGSVQGRLVPVARNVTVVHATQNVTRFGVERGRVVNRSVSVERVERAVGRPVPHLRTVAVESSAGARRERVRGNSVQVFNPTVRRTNVEPPSGGRAPERQANPHDRGVSRGTQTPRPEARSSQTWREPQRSQEEQRARQQETARLEQARRREAQNQQQERTRQRNEQDRRQAQQASEDRRYRQQLENRQAQETRDMERVHDQEIKHPPKSAPTQELQRRQQVEHQALAERHNQQRQDFEASRQQAREAQARSQDQQRQQRAEAGRPTEQNHPKPQSKAKPQPKQKESQSHGG